MAVLVHNSSMPQIEVSEYVKEELDTIKDKEEHKSYDSVVRVMLGNYEQ